MAASLGLEARVAQVWGLSGALRAAGKDIRREAAALIGELPLAAVVDCDAEGRPRCVRISLGGTEIALPLAARA